MKPEEDTKDIEDDGSVDEAKKRWDAYPRLIALLKIINTGDYAIACEIVALLRDLGEIE